jgi:hypothetical protein
MSERLHRRKTILLLLVLIIFSVSTIKLTKNIENKPPSSREYLVAEDVKSDSDENYNLEQNMFFEIDEDFHPIKQVYPSMVLEEEDVLSTTSGACKTPTFSYSTSDICTSTPSQFEMTYDNNFTEQPEIGENIKRNAEVILTRIVQPTLSDGSRTVYSSDMQIRTLEDEEKDVWTFSSAGETITTRVFEGNLEPSSADLGTREIVLKAESADSRTYGTKYEISSGESGVNGEVVDQAKRINDCEECSKSNPTPEKFNIFASFLAQTFNPPGYDPSSENQKEDIKDCSGSDSFVNYNTINVGTSSRNCTRPLGEKVITFVKKIIDMFDAEKCSSTSDSEECINTQDIVVKMSSNWGSELGCTDTECASYYSYLRNSKFKEPGNVSTGKLYIVTPCYANIEGVVKEVQLKCAWDYDYLVKELEFQSFDNLPGEIYPTKEDFIKFNISEDAARTDPEYDLK